MAVYLAFLRGINVGAGNRIRMAALRKVFSDLGFTEVQTYIQSGNVIFCSPAADKQKIASQIEQAVLSSFGFQSPVIIRTVPEISAIVQEAARAAEEIAGDENTSSPAIFEYLHIAMYSGILPPGVMERLKAMKSGQEACILSGQQIFLYLPSGVHASKLAAGISRLGLPVTVRNWKTIHYLAQAVHDPMDGK